MKLYLAIVLFMVRSIMAMEAHDLMDSARILQEKRNVLLASSMIAPDKDDGFDEIFAARKEFEAIGGEVFDKIYVDSHPRDNVVATASVQFKLAMKKWDHINKQNTKE